MAFPEGPALRSRQFLDALVAGDARAAERACHRALRDGMWIAEVQEEVIAPAMREIGRLWAMGSITVADEHLATSITSRVLSSLSAFVGPPDASRGTILLAAVEGERHVLGLEMVARILEGAGFDVRMLGGDVPPDALAASVARFAPAVVGLSVTMPMPDRVREAIDWVRRVDGDVHIILGGMGCPSHLHGVPVVSTAAEGLDLVERLLVAA